MPNKSTRKEIPVSQLVLDLKNPRLLDSLGSQRDAIRVMLESQGNKIVNLAKSIIVDGISPSDSFIVMPDEKVPDQYIVLEGNRRFTTLKILETPSLAELSSNAIITRKLKELGEQYLGHEIEAVHCAVFQFRENANKWIKLRHTGENEGVGIVDWDGLESARFSERQGKVVPHLRLFDFMKGKAGFDDSRLNRISITNLERLVSDPEVRGFLGVDVEAGEVRLTLPEAEVIKGLKKVFADLADKKIKVSDIYSKGDREKYLESFTPEQTPDQSKVLQSPISIDLPKCMDPTPTPTSTEPPPVKNRPNLIPASCAIQIADDRIRKMLWELKRLKVDGTPNATAILFRVFFESSIDHYLSKNGLAGELPSDVDLATKVDAVKADLVALKLITAAELKPINVATNDPDNVLSINTMHAYSDNPNFPPEPQELRSTWDRIQLFMEKIWA